MGRIISASSSKLGQDRFKISTLGHECVGDRGHAEAGWHRQSRLDHFTQIRRLAPNNGQQSTVNGSEWQDDISLNFPILVCLTLGAHNASFSYQLRQAGPSPV